MSFSLSPFKILSSKEYVASAALLALAKDIGLDRALTLASVLETLKSQRRNEVSVAGASFLQLTEPTPEAQSLLDLLTRLLRRWLGGKWLPGLPEDAGLLLSG